MSNTGVSGLTLGGGLGWLMGKHGLSCDNVLSIDLVDADGMPLTASTTEHADLFWALRGGGGNFGVVTSFTFRLFDVGPVLGGMVIYPMSEAGEVLRFYRDFSASLPDEAEAYAGLLTSPDGHPVVAVLLGYNGDLAEGERVFAPMRQFGSPLADLVQPMSYVQRQRLLDDVGVHGVRRYWKSGFARELSDDFLDMVVERATAPALTADSGAVFQYAWCADARRSTRRPRLGCVTHSGTSTAVAVDQFSRGRAACAVDARVLDSRRAKHDRCVRQSHCWRRARTRDWGIWPEPRSADGDQEPIRPEERVSRQSQHSAAHRLATTDLKSDHRPQGVQPARPWQLQEQHVATRSEQHDEDGLPTKATREQS